MSLILCAAYDGSFSFAESRRITMLYEQLTAVCDREGVPPISATPGPEDYLGRSPAKGRDTARELDQLMCEFGQVMRRDRTRGLYGDFFGGPPAPGDPKAPLPGRRRRPLPGRPWRRPWRSWTPSSAWRR